MVHMWVNTVTGCGLPREEINGSRFGPPVNRADAVAIGIGHPGLDRAACRGRVGVCTVHEEHGSMRGVRNCMRACVQEGEGAPRLSSYPQNHIHAMESIYTYICVCVCLCTFT